MGDDATNLCNAPRLLGECRSGTEKLEEAISAYRGALNEYTRERMPLDWAMSIGNQGVAKMILAEQKKRPRDGWDGLKQIEAALEVTRAGGHAPNAVFYEARLTEARALLERLKAR